MDTRQKQLAAWCSLVLSFCRLHKQSSMTVMEAQESPLFNNVKLQRILPQALPHPPHMHFHTFPRAQTSHSSSPTEGSFPPQLALGKSQTAADIHFTSSSNPNVAPSPHVRGSDEYPGVIQILEFLP